jgi:C1A family cysteine protease
MKTDNRKGQASLSAVLSKKGKRTFSLTSSFSPHTEVSETSNRLAKIGIITCEELLSYEYAYGIEAIAMAAGLETNEVHTAASLSKKVVRKGLLSDYIKADVFRTCPHDKYLVDSDLETLGGQVTPVDDKYLASLSNEKLPDSVNLIDKFMPPIRDQWQRGTCVAFATCALLEYEIARAGFKRGRGFSEQYHHWLCKKYDKINDEGTDPGISFVLCDAKGLIPKPVWPYVIMLDKNDPSHHEPPPEAYTSKRYHPTEVPRRL